MSAAPAGWVEVRLGDVCDRAAKWEPRKTPNVEFDYIDIGGIDQQRIVTTKQLLGTDAPSRARQLVEAGDTVLSTVRTYLVNTALVPNELDGATASTGFCVLRPTRAIDPRFLFYRVLESKFVAKLSTFQTGSSYPAVRDRDVFAQEIALPPLAEQRRIVAVVEEQLSRIESVEATLSSATARLSLLEERALESDQGTTQVALGDLALEMRYGTSTKCSYEAAGAPVLRIPNVRQLRVDLADLKRAVEADAEVPRVARDDLLVIRTNGSRSLIGRVAVVDEDAAGMGFASYLIRVRLDPSRADAGYIALALSSRLVRNEIERRAASTAGQYNLSQPILATLELPLPPLADQTRIRAEVETRLRSLARLRTTLIESQRRCAGLRRSILARAFRGELVSQDPTDEPANALLDRIATERATAPAKPRRGRLPNGR